MRSPWHNKSGLAKAAAILATTFSIALGLCGINFAAYITLHPDLPIIVTGLLETGWAELIAMILSLAGLLIVGLLAFLKLFNRGVQPSPTQTEKKGDD
jgi:hypothetical protein